MADKEVLDTASILNIIDTDSTASTPVSKINKTKRSKPSSTSSDLPDFSAEIESNAANKKARKQTKTVEIDLDSEVSNELTEAKQEEIKVAETATDLQQSLILDLPEQTEVKPKKTRKPRTTTPKEKKESKPKVKKPTKEELEVIETQERRANFEVDYYYHELDEMVVEPTEEYLEILSKSFEIGFDIETFGNLKQSDAFEPELGEIRLIQVYLPDSGKVIVWDLGTIDDRKYPSYKDIPGYSILISKLASKTTKVYIHNATFESKWIWEKFNIPILNVVDSMILSQLYYAGLIRGFNRIGISKPNSLDQVVWRLFEVKLDKTDQSYDYACPITNRQLNYGAKDAKYTYKAGVELLRMCHEEGLKKVVDAELAAIPAFAMMCNRGVPFDAEIARSLLADYEAGAAKVLQPWLDRFPDCNPGSPKQVLACLAELNIFPTALDPKTGLMKPCTNNPTLTPYALEDPLIESLLFWRSLKTDCQYLEGYLEAEENVKGFQVVRTVYTQNAPQCTGRSGSSKPNLQNIPTPTPKRKKAGLKPIRTAFRVPDGYKMIIIDLAASHAQIARHVSQDRQLKEAYETGVKLHFFTVSGILKMRGIDAHPAELSKAKDDPEHPLHKDVSELYDPSKTVFYGGLNLNGASTLQASFLKKADMLVDIPTCKLYVEGGRKAYAGLYKFQQKQIADANREIIKFSVKLEDGTEKKVGVYAGVYGTARSCDGGRLFIEKRPSKYKEAWEVKGTDAVSYAWLRPEGTIMKNAMGRIVEKLLWTPEWGAWLAQFTHDEVGIIVKEEYALECFEFCLPTITNSFKEIVPDYEAESTDPKKYIKESWADK